MWAIDSMSRAPRRPSQVLLPKGRMNFLTTREVGDSAEVQGVRPAQCVLAVGMFGAVEGGAGVLEGFEGVTSGVIAQT